MAANKVEELAKKSSLIRESKFIPDEQKQSLLTRISNLQSEQLASQELVKELDALDETSDIELVKQKQEEVKSSKFIAPIQKEEILSKLQRVVVSIEDKQKEEEKLKIKSDLVRSTTRVIELQDAEEAKAKMNIIQTSDLFAEEEKEEIISSLKQIINKEIELEEQKKAEEEARIAKEQKLLEEQRKAEEEARKAEEKRQLELARIAEEKRLAQEEAKKAEAARLAEEERLRLEAASRKKATLVRTSNIQTEKKDTLSVEERRKEVRLQLKKTTRTIEGNQTEQENPSRSIEIRRSIEPTNNSGSGSGSSNSNGLGSSTIKLDQNQLDFFLKELNYIPVIHANNLDLKDVILSIAKTDNQNNKQNIKVINLNNSRRYIKTHLKVVDN